MVLIFVHVSTHYAHFLYDDICTSCDHDRPTSVFFSCETAINMARNAWFKICGESFQPVFNLKKKPTLEQKLICNTAIIFRI